MAEAAAASTSARVQIYPQKSDCISPFLREKYEREASKNWDIFYKRNADRFFKDRHYLDKEWGHYIGPMAFLAVGIFTQLTSLKVLQALHGEPSPTKRVILEVGCGTGNTVFPLVAEFPDIFVHACDFSIRAVNLVKAHQDYSESQVNAFVCDVASQDLMAFIEPSSVDVVTLVFMLSAVSPGKMAGVIQNLKRVLKPGGYVLVRDYAVGDLAQVYISEAQKGSNIIQQERLTCKDQKISENFFARGDGTRAYYFSEDSLVDLLAEEGFRSKAVTVHCRQVENRSRALVMNRRWIQGEFQLPSDETKDIQEDAIPVMGEKPEHAEPRAMAEKVGSLDVDLSEGIGASLFVTTPTLEVRGIEVGHQLILAKVLAKENQHTMQATGLLLWDAAPALAAVLEANPSLLQGKSVLELGCGGTALCSLIASHYSSMIVATDGDSMAMELLHENLELNAHWFPVSKVVCQRLEWAKQEDIAAVASLTRHEGFDLILGTDVTYIAEAVPLMFETARTLIAKQRSGSLHPMLMLCHFSRRVAEGDILAVAASYGFVDYNFWGSNSPKPVVPLGLESLASGCVPLKLMCFVPSNLKVK